MLPRKQRACPLVASAIALAFATLGSLSAGSSAHADALLGVEIIDEPLPIMASAQTFRYPQSIDEQQPMRVVVSRSRYWEEDGHMDVVVQFSARIPIADTHLNVRIKNEAGTPLQHIEFSPPPAEAFIFFPALPDTLTAGQKGTLELIWSRNGELLESFSQPFRVESHGIKEPLEGAIRIDIANPDGVSEPNIPFSVGIPLPRGLIHDVSQLELRRKDGTQVPMQVEERARWTKYGSLKWLGIDFSLDLKGEPEELFLHYRQQHLPPSPHAPATITVTPAAKRGQFPAIDAGTLRIDDRGVWVDSQGNGKFERVLTARALDGAYITHEDGRTYRPASEAEFTIESKGSEKVVVRREGWYREVGGNRKFCKFITRYIIHRNSLWLRVFHTWIFTGNGNHDRIASMGWQVEMSDALQPLGFLNAFETADEWLQGSSLVQFRPDTFALIATDGRSEDVAGRAPGVAAASDRNVRFYFGSKDFWQNYPSELEFADNSLWFHNWPRHNRPATYNYDTDALPEDEWTRNAIQLLFAHQGEVLDFRLPDEFAEDPIRRGAVGGHEEAEGAWLPHQPESANAQGISRTEEFWFYFQAADNPVSEAVTILDNLDKESLRAYPDTRWVARSGAFPYMHWRDYENFPREEQAFELTTHTPALVQDRLGLYGMWIHGDIATWRINLSNRTTALYRAFRSRHHGWPYSWLPYARSGDPQLLKYAEAATRRMIDANYCHYYSDDVDRLAGEGRYRRIGIWSRSLLPWAARHNPTSRCYESKLDYLQHAYYLTGYERARELIESWMEQTRNEEPISRRGPLRVSSSPAPRNHTTLLRSYLDAWEMTHQPWFLVAAHLIADAHVTAYQELGFQGHIWVPAARDFHRYTGDDDFVDYYLHYANSWGQPWSPGWVNSGAPAIEPNAYAWELTGNDDYMRRLEHFVDLATRSVWRGEDPDYMRGHYTPGSSHMIFTGWQLNQFPIGLAALHEAGRRFEIIPQDTMLSAERNLRPARHNWSVPIITTLKTGPLDIPIALRMSSRQNNATGYYTITGPGNQTFAEGSWTPNDGRIIVIPASAPDGAYRVDITFSENSSIRIPLTPIDQPEVLEHDTSLTPFIDRNSSSFWFMVPDNQDTLNLTIPLEGGARQITVFNPDGGVAYDLSYHPDSWDGPDPLEISLPVTTTHRGKLWRISLPGNNRGFLTDGTIPNTYSTTPTRWFNPTEFD